VKILLDENLDWRLSHYLLGHEVASVPLIGWAGLKNGALLAQAQDQFEVLLTMDSRMLYQQNLVQYRIAVIALKARSNRLADTRLLMPQVLAALPSAKPGTAMIIQ
jgi:hypothetical protein